MPMMSSLPFPSFLAWALPQEHYVISHAASILQIALFRLPIPFASAPPSFLCHCHRPAPDPFLSTSSPSPPSPHRVPRTALSKDSAKYRMLCVFSPAIEIRPFPVR